jgi:hypothetical protein
MNDVFEKEKEPRDWWRGETAIYRKEMEELLVSICELILRGFINISALNFILTSNKGSIASFERISNTIPGLISKVRTVVHDCTINMSQQVRSTVEGFNFNANSKIQQELSQVFENMDLSCIEPSLQFKTYHSALGYSLKTYSKAISSAINYGSESSDDSNIYTSKVQSIPKGSPITITNPIKREIKPEDLLSSLLLDSYEEEKGNQLHIPPVKYL